MYPLVLVSKFISWWTVLSSYLFVCNLYTSIISFSSDSSVFRRWQFQFNESFLVTFFFGVSSGSCIKSIYTQNLTEVYIHRRCTDLVALISTRCRSLINPSLWAQPADCGNWSHQHYTATFSCWTSSSSFRYEENRRLDDCVFPEPRVYPTRPWGFLSLVTVRHQTQSYVQSHSASMSQPWFWEGASGATYPSFGGCA